MLEKLKELRQQKKILEEQISEIEKSILEENSSAIEKEISVREYPTGTVSLDNVRIVYPKKVDWDQEELDKLYKDGAKDYINVKYSVSESDYDKWSDNIKKYFSAARCVKVGKPRIEIMEGE